MKSKIHFGVKSANGSSNVWECWTDADKGDAYLTSDVLKKALKLSDHPSGRSHIAYHFFKWKKKLFELGMVPNGRFILEQEDARRIAQPCRHVGTVYFPSGSLSSVVREAPSGTIWLPEAPDGQATEVGVFRFNAPTLPDVWPGKGEGASLVGDLPMPADGRLAVVWRHAPFQMPPLPNRIARHGLFKGITEADMLEANRMVTFGETDTGAFALVEIPVQIGQDTSG